MTWNRASRGAAMAVGVSHDGAVGPLLVRLLIRGGDVRVEQVVEVDADIGAPVGKAEDLGEAHVDQVDALAACTAARA